MSFSFQLHQAVLDLPEPDARQVLRGMAGVCEDNIEMFTERERQNIARIFKDHNMPGFAYMLENQPSDQSAMAVRPKEDLPEPAEEAEQREIVKRILEGVRDSKKNRDQVETEITGGYLSPHRARDVGNGVHVDYAEMFQNLEKLSPERRRQVLVNYFDQRTFNPHAIEGGFGKWLQDPEFFKDFIRAGKGYLLFFPNETFTEFILYLTPVEFNDENAKIFIESGDITSIARNIKYFAGLSRFVFESILEADLGVSEYEAVYENTQAFRAAEIDQDEIRRSLLPKLQKIIKRQDCTKNY